MSLVPANAPTFAVDGSGNLTITSNSGDSATLELSPTGIGVLRTELATIQGAVDAPIDQLPSVGTLTVQRTAAGHLQILVDGIVAIELTHTAAGKVRRGLASLGSG